MPLPKLPVPEVKDTMNKYLTVLSTVISPHELNVTKKHVQQFMTPGGWGDKLQYYLLQRRSETDNWASEWWLRTMYLDNRLPLPFNSSPASILSTQLFSSKEDCLRFAARLSLGIVDYTLMIDSGTLPVEMADKNQPMCMEQDYRLFSSYRRPGIPSDQLITHLGTQRPAFMVVACRNQFYRVDVEQDGVTLSEGELFSQLCKVVSAADRHAAGSPPVGVLTAIDRSAWAEARERLAAAGENSSHLDTIENSLFILCLDTPVKRSSSSSAREGVNEKEEEELTNLAQYALHGQGTDFNSCNRWFDKPMQWILSEDGTFVGVGEHSASEGRPQLVAANYAFTKTLSSHPTCERNEGQDPRCLAEPVWLKWTTTSEIESDIARAKEEVDRNVQRPGLCGRRFNEFGREFPKSQGISPDTFLQLAIQMAYYRMHGRMAMTYESATLRRFRQGREDNIRINSPAVLTWIQAMCGEIHTSEAEKFALFEAACDWKEKYKNDVVAGYGTDCHLIGLREAARELNVLDSIPLFSDPSFQKAFYFPLSTSQVPNIFKSFGFFAPLTPDGYGVGYKLFPDCVILCVTSYNDCEDTDCREFTTCLEKITAVMIRKLSSHAFPLVTALSLQNKAWTRVAPRTPPRLYGTAPLSFTFRKLLLQHRGPRQSPSPPWMLPLHSVSCELNRKANYSDNSAKRDSSGYGASVQMPLPKLPVPKVKDTMNKYLTVLSTVISPHELNVTKKHVQQFMTPGGWGDKLQYYLLQRQSETDNWASEWWLRTMYLDNRLPLPFNSSPAMLLSTQLYSGKEDCLRGTLPVEMADKNQPMCMEQDYRLFSSYRRPGIPSDQLITHLGTQRPAFMFYRVDVEQDGVTLSEGELFSQLCKVVSAAERHAAGSPPVGVLTAVDRSAWAEARKRLAAAGENSSHLDTIENSLFILCLDTPVKPSSSSSAREGVNEKEENLAQYALHGQGTGFNSCNRWFDKPMQWTLSEDGTFAVVTEHSVSEARPQMVVMDYAITRSLSSHPTCERNEGQDPRCLAEPLWLKWTTTSEIESDIARAKEEVDRNVQRPGLCGRRFNEFGREFPKSQGISPDTFLQLAIQMAYYRMHGRMAMTYESATLRRFRQGREDNIRINSPAVLTWIQAMCREIHTSEAKKFALFEAACDWKEKYKNDVVAGYGTDCHLIGLREAARELNVLDSIPLFSDPSFQKAFYFPLSTSQVPNIFKTFGFFAPLTPDGYGVGYKLFPDCVILCVTSYNDCEDTDCREFTTCLESCLLEMRDFCLLKN
ncbi:uncharacterized protein LOC143289937 [Babylonia areolata]|uniref:uncharacterized protein LOC143289937 n=1 Tax=Babylonia areolata TaxID=304850 RepID=UPI003FD2650F